MSLFDAIHDRNLGEVANVKDLGASLVARQRAKVNVPLSQLQDGGTDLGSQEELSDRHHAFDAEILAELLRAVVALKVEQFDEDLFVDASELATSATGEFAVFRSKNDVHQVLGR